MFKLIQPESYTWPIVVSVPVDGGRTEKQTFDGTFKRLSQSRIEEIKALIEKNDVTDVSLAKEVLVGWHGVVDAAGEEVPFSEKSRDGLLDVPLVATSVVMAFLESLSGARRKN